MQKQRLSKGFAFAGMAMAYIGMMAASGAPSPLYVHLQAQWGFSTWMLTLAFAVYALSLLVTLIIAGSLSDYIGRRPVLIAALVIQLASMTMFAFAQNIEWIVIARVLQGIATGAATSTFTAAILELAPENKKKLGAVISSVVPVGGLAVGAIATGLAIQLSTQPSLIVFGALDLLSVIGTLTVIFSPETVTRRPGAIRSLLPRLSIPGQAKREFGAAIPVLLGTWMMGGLILGIAPSILRNVFHVESGLANGLVVALQPTAATISGLIFGRIDARRAVAAGTSIVMVGMTLAIVAIISGVLPLFIVAAAVSGTGFGAAFGGTMRILGGLANPAQKAELFAAVYVASYLSLGAPVLIVGQIVTFTGLLGAVTGYIAVALAAAAAGLLARLKLNRVIAADLTLDTKILVSDEKSA